LDIQIKSYATAFGQVAILLERFDEKMKNKKKHFQYSSYVGCFAFKKSDYI